ncbi:uncharacterized protein [Musca autumnalis]|uniref:uncharacterized protein n=1 Tax=Musca autumnalis TaxID=221902 RepID=UPI003CF869CF
MTMEWTREKTLALIQEYRKRRGLWDMTHEDYRKKDVKHKLLVEVVESLGGNIPILEIEKKFHTLRTQYHREINRMKRKEPYNSKWFGFKCLQFLSSPKACRSNKGGRIKEITEDGTMTTKYIIREAIPVQQHDTSVGSANDDNEEFLTLQRRPTTITYEAVPAGNATSTSSSRSHELEKLIEETTKDVEEIEDTKPKMTIKEISVPPLEHQQQHHHHHHHQQQQQQHHSSATYTHAGASELQITNVETEHEDLHHIEDDNDQIDSLNIQGTSDEEINYSTSSVNNGGNGNMVGGAASTNPTNNTTTVHTIPARIIKIQRRETHDQGEYYEQHHAAQQQHHPQQQHHSQQHHQNPATTHHHIHTVSPSGATTTKRIYYDASGHHTATILTPTQPQQSQHHQQQQSSGMTILNASTSSLSSPTSSSKLHLRNTLAASGTIHTMSATSPPLTFPPNTVVTTNPAGTASSGVAAVGSLVRDEYVTYGEYVANEMRNITSREILISLKHKINTALFEANMQELQK